MGWQGEGGHRVYPWRICDPESAYAYQTAYSKGCTNFVQSKPEPPTICICYKKTWYMGIGITNHSVGVIVTSYKSSKRQQLTVHTDGSVCHLSRVKGDIFQLTDCLQYYSLTKQFHNSLPERPFMCIVHCEMCELTSKLIK